MEDSKPRQTRRRFDEQTWRALLERFDGAAMTVKCVFQPIVDAVSG